MSLRAEILSPSVSSRSSDGRSSSEISESVKGVLVMSYHRAGVNTRYAGDWHF